MPIGFTFPFAKASASVGYLATTDTEFEAVKNDMRALVLTNWGERPNHYYLGCNLSEFLFSQMTEETHDKIVQRVSSQISKWLPFIVINSIDVQFTEEMNRIKIVIDYSSGNNPDLSSVLTQIFPAGA